MSSRTYKLIAGATQGENCSDTEFGSPLEQAWKLNNLIPEGGELRLFGGRDAMWNTSWYPDVIDAVYDWTVDAVHTLAATTHRLVLARDSGDNRAALFIESDLGIGEFDCLYTPNDDPNGTVSYTGAYRCSFAEMNGLLFIEGLGRKVTDDATNIRYYAPLVWDGSVQRITSCTVTSGTKDITTSLLTADAALFDASNTRNKPIKKGDRITLTNGTTGAAETRNIVHFADVGGTYHIYVDANFTNTHTAERGVVATLNYAGIESPQTTPTLGGAAGTGNPLTIDKIYTYKYCYENSIRGTSSIASREVAATPTISNQKYIPQGWAADPIDSSSSTWGHFQIDKIAIYRTVGNGDIFYLVTRLLRTSGASPDSYNFATTYTDYVYDTTLQGLVDTGSIAELQAADVADGNMTLYGQPGTERIITVSIKNPTGGALTTVESTYTITGTLASGASDTDTITVDARSIPAGKTYTWNGTKNFTNITTIAFATTGAPTQPAGLQHSAGVLAATAETYGSDNNAPAPAITRLLTFNDRLWGNDSHKPTRRECSTLGNPEYWPLYDTAAAIPTGTNAFLGTYFDIGGPNDPLVTAVPELGAYSSTGTTGDCQLIFTRNKAYRLFGHDISDFRITRAFDTGCVATLGAVNCGGVIIWPSRRGIEALDAGGSMPKWIGKPVRRLVKSYMPQLANWADPHYTKTISTANSDPMAAACAVYWNGLYIICHRGPKPETTNAETLAYRLSDGVWFNLNGASDGGVAAEGIKAVSFHVSEGALDDTQSGSRGDLLWCNSQSLSGTSRPLYRFRDRLKTNKSYYEHYSNAMPDGTHYFTGSALAGVAFRYVTKAIPLPESDRQGGAHGFYSRKQIKRIIALVDPGDTDLTLTLGVWDLGWNASRTLEDPDPLYSTTPAVETSVTVTATSGLPTHRIAVFEPNVVCRWAQLALYGTSKSDVRIKPLQIEWEEKSTEDFGATGVGASGTGGTLVAQSDSALVSFVRSDAGASAQGLNVKLSDYISVEDFGAVGDGITDDTTAIQNALTAAAVGTAGGQTVHANGRYKIDGALSVPAGVTLQGNNSMTLNHASGVVEGSTFVVDQTTLVPVTLAKGSAIRGFCFHYPDQPVSDDTPTIITYQTTIVCGNGSQVSDVWCSGAYDFIEATDACTLTNIGGYPVRYGIYIESSADTIRMHNVIFHPNYLISSVAVPWGFYWYCGVNLEGAAVRIVSADDVKATNVFGFGYTYGVQTGITTAGGGGTPSLQLSNFGFEMVKQGFNLGGSPNGFGIFVSNGFVGPTLGTTAALRRGIMFRGKTSDSGGLYVFNNVSFYGDGTDANQGGSDYNGMAECHIDDNGDAPGPVQNTLIMRNCVFRQFTNDLFYDVSGFSGCRYWIEGHQVPAVVTNDSTHFTSADEYRLTEPVLVTNQPEGPARFWKDIANGGVDCFKITVVSNANHYGGAYTCVLEGTVETFAGDIDNSVTLFSTRGFKYIFTVGTLADGGTAARSAVTELYLSAAVDSVGATQTISGLACTIGAGDYATETVINLDVTGDGTAPPTSFRVTANIDIIHSTHATKPFVTVM